MDARVKFWYHRWRRHIIDGLLLRGRRRSLPKNIIIETTNSCSLKCSCCPNGFADAPKRQRGMMSRDTFDAVLRNLDFTPRHCYLHMCGEPFLNRDLPYFTERLLERGIYPVIYSNGYRIDIPLLREILRYKSVKTGFSMDLSSPTHYEGIRTPGRYDEAMRSLEEIDRAHAEAGRVYELNVIADATATDTIPQMCESLFARFPRLNKISISSRWPWPGLPSTGDLAGHMSVRRQLCPEVASACPVLWDGRVAFCSFDYPGANIVGDATVTPYTEIYNGTAARRLRRALYMRRRGVSSLCDKCLLCRFEPLVASVTRNRFRKMSGAEREAFAEPFRRYYAF